ncbi:MAG TPA: ABC transporter permease [Solirubrobacteraceae bacterium]|nr:ABC transporter permease [Solirubrobacteraceae bacterium]
MTTEHRPPKLRSPGQTVVLPEEPAQPDGLGDAGQDGSRLRAALGLLHPRRTSAIYVFIAIFIIFSLWVPSTFLSGTTWKTLLDEQAITAIVAVGLIIPMAAGAFDLAVGSEVGFGVILVAWLLADKHVALIPGLALTLLAGALIGVMSGLLITRVRIDSFIATLGVSSILTAMTTAVSGGEEVLNLPIRFENLGSNQLLGLQYPVYYLIVVAAVAWYVLERTPIGRRIYATGGNIEAARLSGINTGRVIICTLIAGGVIAAAGGALLSASLDAGDPTVGPSYLLPVLSAAFLGSTQIKPGRFNVLGTVLAVYVLAAGVKGLELAGAPDWIPDLFNGLALLIAVGVAKTQRRNVHTSSIRRLVDRSLRRGGDTSAAASGGYQNS